MSTSAHSCSTIHILNTVYSRGPVRLIVLLMLFLVKKPLAVRGLGYAEAGITGVVGGGGKNEDARALALALLSEAMFS